MQSSNIKQKILAIDSQYVQELLANLTKVQPQNKQHSIRYTLTGSGCRQNAQLLSLPIFRISMFATLFAIEKGQSISIMITASHNPAADNGIKFGYTHDNTISKEVYKEIEDCLNSQQMFEDQLQNKLNLLEASLSQNNKPVCFLGRDARNSSPYLSKIVQQVYEIFQIRYINLEICATPQLYSFGKYLLQSNLTTSITNPAILEGLKLNYVSQTMSQFSKVYEIVTKNKEDKQKVLLDFSNGSGVISFLPYLPHLQKYFQIQCVNDKQFSNPNHLCGADYIYRNWKQALDQKYGNKTLIFFDGDSDRIVIRLENNKQCFDGNYFLILYTKALIRILKSLENENILNKKEFQFNTVVPYMVNLGVKQQLNKIDINCIISNVGIQNLFVEVLKNKMTVFFQPNGHGGVYFSPQIINKIKQLMAVNPENEQLKILFSFYLILKNNSRGYALHNMLMFFICKAYLKIQSLTQLFQFTHEIIQKIYIQTQSVHLFTNSQERNNQLASPQNVIEIADKLMEDNKDYLILLRKSETQKTLVRLSVQGKDINKCKEIAEQILEAVDKLGYLSKLNNLPH